jgi:hypothetical protein
MADSQNGTQEPKPERTSVMLTMTEKRAIRLLAAARDSTESDVLRAHVDWGKIMADYEKVRPAADRVAV